MFFLERRAPRERCPSLFDQFVVFFLGWGRSGAGPGLGPGRGWPGPGPGLARAGPGPGLARAGPGRAQARIGLLNCLVPFFPSPLARQNTPQRRPPCHMDFNPNEHNWRARFFEVFLNIFSIFFLFSMRFCLAVSTESLSMLHLEKQ